MAEYVLVKFAHILIAIVALGTSAGLGIVLELYGNHPVHGTFVLRAIERMTGFLVLPGYALMLATGLWMVSLAWTWTTHWILAALGLWGLGALVLGIFFAVLHKQIRLSESVGSTSKSYRRIALFSRILGGAAGLVMVLILYFMVFKPVAWAV
jgi:hypothetical protein